MTSYNVYITRKVSVKFVGVDADSPEDAASTARGFATGGAERIDDCEDLSAEVYDERGGQPLFTKTFPVAPLAHSHSEPEHLVFTIDPSDPNADFRIQQALTACNLIAVTWCIEDVKGIRPDLDEDQCWEVLERAKDQHDADYGITWTFLRDIADELFNPDGETNNTDEE
jgi:hypothetical protein